ncbi:MAG TPA: VOC family protein [Polyangiaceae bacterium]|jgi:catechol 2,3-dioxygenase-like lactoylglutathione lyase family enzyme
MTTRDSSLTRQAGPQSARPAPLGVRFLRAKGTSVGMSVYNVWARLRHRVGFGPRVFGLDHVTLPCKDLRVAEEFYIGLLGARVLMRVDAAFLRKVGRHADADAGAIHTSIVFSTGARLDLFIQPDGQPPPLAGHPHHAMAIGPGAMLRWKKRLNDAGVPTFGPTRLGPPGQASLYFNDPSGNHLELVTHGFVPDIPIGPPDMETLAYEWRGA